MYRPRALSEIEREAILLTLYYFKGNISHSARTLGLSVRGLRLKLRQYEAEGEWIVPKQDHWRIPSECRELEAD